MVKQGRQIGSQNLDLAVAEEGEVRQNRQEVEAGEAARQRKALVVVGEHLIEVKEVAEEHLNEVKGAEEERLFAVVVVGAARLTEVREEVVVVRCLSKEGEVQGEKMQAVALNDALRQEMSAKSLARSQHFSWHRAAVDTLDALERVVSARKGNKAASSSA